MRLPVALGIYLVAVFIGGALIAPCLHAVVAWGADHFPALEKLAYQPFHRYVNRCFMIIAIIGLWPIGRLARLTAPDAGWTPDPHWRRRLSGGFFAGFVTLAIPAILCVVSGNRALNWPAEAALLWRPLLEEAVFRGVVFGALKKQCPLRFAVGFSSGIYALVHFFERTQHEGDVVWSSGIALLPKMLRGFADWQMIVPGLFSLTIAGIILALAVRATGNLYFSIGLHAGWIFWLKSFKFFTRTSENPRAWLFGSDKLIDGWAAFVMLLVTLGILWRVRFFCGGGQNGEPMERSG
jgi:membrane protease YdiL (CAAX protease family)